jgi:hypothetical protein
VQGDKEQLIQELGNLTVSGRGVRPSQAPFVPCCAWSTASRVWGWIIDSSHNDRNFSKAEQDARGDLVKLGAVTVEQGRRFVAVWPAAAFEHRVKELLGREPYLIFWKALLDGVPYGTALERALALGALAPGTRTWLGTKLANWGRSFGYLPCGRLSARRGASEAQIRLSGL